MNSPTFARPGLGTFGLLAALGSALLLAFFRMYSTFVWYDDDGYLLITIRSFLDGHPLYNETYTNYGPFYYLWRFALHGVCGLPVTHDATRMVALFEWGLCGIFAVLLLRQATGNAIFSAAGGILVFLFLEPVTKEPSHPQLLAMSVTLAALWTFTHPSFRRINLFATGLLVGALVGIKPNLGAFVILGLALVQCRRMGTAGFAFVGLVAIALPIFLMKGGFSEPTVLYYGIVSSLAILALVLDRRIGPSIDVKAAVAELAWISGGAVLAYVIAVSFALIKGTSFSTLLDGVFFRSVKFAGAVAGPKPFSIYTIVLAFFAVVTSAWLSWTKQGRAFSWDVGAGWGCAILGILSFSYLLTGCAPLTEGGETRAFAAGIVGMAVPWAFLLRPVKVSETDASRVRGTREALVAVAVMHVAIGFPAAGTQLACGGSIFVLAALAAAHQGLRQHFGKAAPEKAAVGMALLAAVVPAWAAFKTFRAYTPLSLPGAQWLRLEPELAAQFHATTTTLHTNGGPFLTVFGLNSLYLWTEMAPPTSANATLWPWMLNEPEQSAVINALERDERSAVLVVSGSDYLKQGATNHVLGRWIVARTAPSSEVGPGRWQLRKRRSD